MLRLTTFSLLIVVLLLAVAIQAGASLLPKAQFFYVAPDGNDGWSGNLAEPNAAKTDGPFATLEAARDAIRKLKKTWIAPAGKVQIAIRGGTYALTQAFELTAEDSGAADGTIEYAANAGEEVRLIGGKAVKGFVPVSDPAILERLEEAARGHVLQADLKGQGVTDFGAPSGGGMEVFFQDKPMTLARWPNEGFTRIVEEAGGDKLDIRGTKGDRIGKWIYEGDRPARWKQDSDAWVHGYWFWDWSDQRHKVKAIDAEKRTIEVEPPYHGYGYRKGQWYYAYNLLSEIDTPGEWYVDRAAGVLYFWPPAPIESGEVVVSILPTLVTMKEVSYVTLRGLTFEAARATGVTISGGTQNRVIECTLRNLGANAVAISDGEQHGVEFCTIYQTGGGGISLNGGDRKTLKPAGHFADNNHIHDYGRWSRMYQPAISMVGVGLRAAHNLIHDAPHMGILFGGNEHVMEFNEIHHVCLESNDAGAIYAGRDWTMRGNVIRYNYLHDVTGFENRGCVGVYLDDMFASAAITGNVFFRVTNAAFIGGGRDCTVENNVFMDCKPALHVDARALGWAHDHADGWIKEAQEKGTLMGIAYKEPPYSERYPQLINILDDEPKAPKGNVIARNICWGGTWDDVEDKARPYLKFEDNMLEDPHFVNAEKLDFRFTDESPDLKRVFKSIPVDQIGIRQGNKAKQ